MKKFFGIICIVAIISLPIMPQDSPPANLPITANMSGGCFVGVAGSATWASVPLPTNNDEVNAYVVSDEGLIPVFISFRLEPGHLAKLVMEVEGVGYNGNPEAYNPELVLWTLWQGDFAFDGAVPPLLTQQEIYVSPNERGRRAGSIQVSFMNKIDRPSGEYTANLILTLLDVVE